jgi:hypothetical protein
VTGNSTSTHGGVILNRGGEVELLVLPAFSSPLPRFSQVVASAFEPSSLPGGGPEILSRCSAGLLSPPQIPRDAALFGVLRLPGWRAAVQVRREVPGFAFSLIWFVVFFNLIELLIFFHQRQIQIQLLSPDIGGDCD